jgi:hypothetical protein
MPSSNLSRNTSGTGTSNQKFTMSLWIKKSSTDSAVRRLIELYNSSTHYVSFRFRDDSSSRLDFYSESNGASVNLRTNRSFRDLSAWYHVMMVVDTTLATADDRMKMYVNGVQETSFALRTNPSLNENLNFNNSGNGQYIARAVGTETDRMFDGSMTHIHFIDGTAYDASYFGETDATTGIWKPKTSPSVTYGNNGFFLKAENSGALGTDSSGNANNFTVNGTPTQTIDTPSNVFATLNPLYKGESGNDATFSNGNLKIVTNSTSQKNAGLSTFGISSGKYYSEFKLIAEASGESTCGVTYNPEITSQIPLIGNYGYAIASNGTAFYGGSSHGVGAWSNTFTTNDIIGVALDLDNNRVTFSKNGSWTDGSGNWDETSPIAYLTLSADQTYFIGVSDKSTSQSSTWESNFGNGYFGTTAVASGNADDNGLGIFEYAPPTGYLALCTKNINEQEYS